MFCIPLYLPTKIVSSVLVGRYYLVDKGYPNREGYMVPYSRTRYHRVQFLDVQPENSREAFNKVHSSLRSCIERCFGVLKARWKILRCLPQYSMRTQVDIILACFALNNFILRTKDEGVVEPESGVTMDDDLQSNCEEGGSEEDADEGIEGVDLGGGPNLSSDSDYSESDGESTDNEEEEDANDGSTRATRDHIARMLWQQRR